MIGGEFPWSYGRIEEVATYFGIGLAAINANASVHEVWYPLLTAQIEPHPWDQGGEISGRGIYRRIACRALAQSENIDHPEAQEQKNQPAKTSGP